MKMKRYKANARERNRIHGLNKPLDAFRRCRAIKRQDIEDVAGNQLKLSKIETFRLVRNYVVGISQIFFKRIPVSVNPYGKFLFFFFNDGNNSNNDN
ncbi:hypothetical protein ABEB36_003991 [Hypothenemus hampei]|uniref:BHLH domain-containing protein n=1 Tax=Hypothenemus hampei TaxID=57062 RepID=A0ABD1F1W0_HYPHA